MVKTPICTRYTTRDNAGIKSCYSINFKQVCGPLGEILASVTTVNNTKFKKGDLIRLVVIGAVRPYRRKTGIVSFLGYNGAIALKKDGSPVASRLWGPVWLEARPAGYVRLAVLSRALL